jgi:hypothetical protein
VDRKKYAGNEALIEVQEATSRTNTLNTGEKTKKNEKVKKKRKRKAVGHRRCFVGITIFVHTH